jgi:hypothetical protein
MDEVWVRRMEEQHQHHEEHIVYLTIIRIRSQVREEGARSLSEFEARLKEEMD